MSEPQKLRSAFWPLLLFVGSVGTLLALLAAQVFCAGGESYRSVNTAEEFNAGNAAYQLGHYGEALWHYERARQSSPRDADILQNLSLAQKGTGLLEQPAPLWHERLGTFLSSEGWVLVACLGLWSGVIIILVITMMHWRGAIPVGLLLLAVLVLAVGAIGTVGALDAQRFGVAVKETTLKLAPTRQSPGSAVIAEGERARVLEHLGDYVRVETPSGKTGWALSADVKPLY